MAQLQAEHSSQRLLCATWEMGFGSGWVPFPPPTPRQTTHPKKCPFLLQRPPSFLASPFFRHPRSAQVTCANLSECLYYRNGEWKPWCWEVFQYLFIAGSTVKKGGRLAATDMKGLCSPAVFHKICILALGPHHSRHMGLFILPLRGQQSHRRSRESPTAVPCKQPCNYKHWSWVRAQVILNF